MTSRTTEATPALGRIAVLDLVRALAALEVFFGHARLDFFRDWAGRDSRLAELLYFATGFGKQAVMVFFVMSGFLVGNSVLEQIAANRFRWSRYLLRRLTRLYIALVPALVLGAIWDAVSLHVFHVGQLSDTGSLATHFTLRNWIGNLFFTQGILVDTFGSNGPLWSLTCELVYYLAFPLLAAAALRSSARPVKRLAWGFAGAVLLALSGGFIASYFVMWLAGVVAARAPSPTRRAGLVVGVVGSAGLATALLLIGTDLSRVGWRWDLTVAMPSAILVWALRALPPSRGLWSRGAGHLADSSYTLYLAHAPALVCLGAWATNGVRWQTDPRHLALGALLTLAVFGYTQVVWWLAEARTDATRTWLAQRLFPEPKPAAVDVRSNLVG
jgi:peptidoglycan/LPS O-acetylase OafA/YrhL